MILVSSTLIDADKGGRLRLFSQDVLLIPIRTISFSNPSDKAMHDRMVEMVERMLSQQERADRAGNDGPAEEARLSRVRS